MGEETGTGSRRRFRRRKASHSPVRKRRWVRRTVIGLVVVVVLAGALGATAYWYVGYRFGQIRKVTVDNLKPVAKPGAPFNVLLVGSDSRAFVDTPGGCKAFGCGPSQGGQRSDVIVIARVVPATRQIEMMSIPRDTYVDIPGNIQYISGQNRINVAFNSGPSLLVQTIEQDIHIPINYYVEVNFPGLSGIVQAIGGIHLSFRYPVKDTYTGLDVTSTGCQLLNGVQALALVRSRHMQYEASPGVWSFDYGSDFSRIHNQQAFFHAVIKQLDSQITNPIALNDFIGAAAHDLTIDQTITKGLLFSLAGEFRNLSPGALHSETFPTVGPYITPGGADVLLPAGQPDDVMVRQFLAFGSPSTPVAPTRTTSTGSTAAPGSTSSGTAGGTTTSSTGTSATTTTTLARPTVTTVAPIPAGEYPIYNNQVSPWTPVPC